MNIKRKLLTWLPRIISILAIGFISIFALDVFEEHQFPEVIWALLIHLLPSIGLLIILAIAWKKPIIGGALFIIPAIYYIYSTWGKGWIAAYFLISGPFLLVGVLFILSGILNRKRFIRKNKEEKNGAIKDSG